MIGEVALTAGVLVLLLVVWLIWWTARSGEAASAREVSVLEQQWNALAGGPARSPGPGQHGAGNPLAAGSSPSPVSGAFAVLRIPRFGARWSEPVLEGTGPDQLRRGVGHYSGTAMPGAAGNLGIAGHRTTWGHPFGDIQRLRSGDAIVVETAAGRFVYRVSGHEVVAPAQRSVLAPVPGHPGQPPGQAWLTLTTCHPAYSARQRWVVHALLETSLPRSAGPAAVAPWLSGSSASAAER